MIEIQIDNDRRLVLATATGVLSEEDILTYMEEFWSLQGVEGYNELLDLREVKPAVSFSSKRLRDLSQLAASMDVQTTATKFAIVVQDDFLFEFARTYEIYRNSNPQSTKHFCTFRTMQDALAWIGENKLRN
ncbi:MAG: hypothetical protein HQL08_13760 [Nitrospirae bacterium]|nr:hypothetical protein [Nitrospirota bacterium]